MSNNLFFFLGKVYIKKNVHLPSQELEAIKARVREMEEEAEKLKELQNEVEKQMNLSPPPGK